MSYDTDVWAMMNLLYRLGKMCAFAVNEFLPSASAVGNNFSRVCLSVCPSVCLSVYPDDNFEPVKVGTSCLAHTYIFIVSRSSLSTKVIGSRSFQMTKIS